MSNRIYNLIVFTAILLFGLIVSISAQSKTDETANVKKRAETLLQIIREEKWDELDKFVVVVVEQIDKETGKTVKSLHKINDIESKEKVIKRFKIAYLKKPGKILGVRLNKKDETSADVTYRHEDKDQFTMVLLDGDWYYAFEYLR